MLTLLHFCFSYETSQFLSCLQDLLGTFSHGKPQLCDYWTIYSSGAEANATLSAGIDSMGIKTRTNALQWCQLKDFKRYFKATRLLWGFLQPRKKKTPKVTSWRIKWIMRHTSKFMLPLLYTCLIFKHDWDDANWDAESPTVAGTVLICQPPLVCTLTDQSYICMGFL